MTVANTTTHANAIQTIYTGVAEGVFLNSAIYELFGEPAPRSNFGDSKYTWGVHSGVNTGVELFTEDTTYPTATYQAVVKAQVSPLWARCPIQVTGILLDVLGNAGNYSALELEMSDAIAQIRDLMTTSFLGSTYGIELAYDYGSSYAGITRNGSASYFEASETAVDAAVELSDYEDLLETCLLYTSPSPRDGLLSRMPSSA